MMGQHHTNFIHDFSYNFIHDSWRGGMDGRPATSTKIPLNASHIPAVKDSALEISLPRFTAKHLPFVCTALTNPRSRQGNPGAMQLITDGINMVQESAALGFAQKTNTSAHLSATHERGCSLKSNF